MKWNQTILAFFLLLLSVLPITAVGNTNEQSNMRIPLKQESGNLAIQLDSMVIKLIDFHIQPCPWNDRSPQILLKMKIKSQSNEYETALSYYEINNSQIQNNFPLAIGKYLFNLDIRKDSVDLLISRLRIGDTFVFDRKYKKGITIDGLTITYDYGTTANLIDENGDFDGYKITDSFKLSENGEEEVVSFLYVSTGVAKDNVSVNNWKGYKIEVSDNYYEHEPLSLKVTKE